MPTFAEYLINDQLPDDHKIKGTIDNKSLKKALISFAQKDPNRFPKAVTGIKEVGDLISTYDGMSVGLDDITPQYNKRNKLMQWAMRDLRTTKNKKALQDKLLAIQAKAMGIAKEQGGTMGTMVRSGGRGNAAQMMKTVVSPVVVRDNAGAPYPYLIKNSYSEGLTPAEYWIASNEARQEVIRGQLSTAIPGDMGKQIASTLINVQVTKRDCGTQNGLTMDLDDEHIIDRYLAADTGGVKRNELITTQIVRRLRKKKISEILVRSPMTCNENPGVCQLCYGLNEKGRNQSLGTHVGLRSAQALAEPLTQMVLSSKHGVQLAKGEEAIGTLEGVRQLLEIPESFKRESVLSKKDGRVQGIRSAPQGGKYVNVDDEDHYVHPQLDLKVSKGDKVYAGDQISTGLMNPKQLIKHKGLGVGRKYLADKMYDFYKADGIDIDKRHLELLARQNYNYVQIEPDGDAQGDGEYIPGDIVGYNALKDKLRRSGRRRTRAGSAIGESLTEPALHYTAGTRITPEIARVLDRHKHQPKTRSQSVKYRPVVKPLEQVPLLSPDWVTRMGHRRLKDTLLQGAMYNYISPLSGESPYTNYIYSLDPLDHQEVEY